MEVYTEVAAENQAAHFSENLDEIHPKRKAGVEIVRSAEVSSRLFRGRRPRSLRNSDSSAHRFARERAA